MVGIKEKLCTGLIKIDGEGSWPLESLIDVAARRNSTRGYLLVSKVLGKHIPTSTETIQKTYIDLASMLPSEIDGPVVFVGMGETATALGFGVYEEWRKHTQREDAIYIHTTRYQPYGSEVISFQETHSHGPSQLLSIPSEGSTKSIWSNSQTLVIIDDEVTTGATAHSLVDSIEKNHQRFLRKYLVSLVSPKNDFAFKRAHPDWSIISLSKIDLSFSPGGVNVSHSDPQGVTCVENGKGSHYWGRIAVHTSRMPTRETLELARSAALNESLVYIIGAGEFMYPAYVIGRYLQCPGKKVFIQATTRSPVMIGNAIKASIKLDDGLGSGVSFYLHNPPKFGSCIIALHEKGCSRSTQALVERLGAIAIEV